MEERMGIVNRIMVLVVIAVWPVVASADTLTAEEAASHVGETATVCGTVASANYATRSKGQPTFLNLDKAYPHQAFTVVIWGSDRSKFGTPETALSGKVICATGAIQLYRGSPEVIVHDPGQLVQK
jgi:DNA/RNA endonuclease YhcR with UshA esterase domain